MESFTGFRIVFISLLVEVTGNAGCNGGLRFISTWMIVKCGIYGYNVNRILFPEWNSMEGGYSAIAVCACQLGCRVLMVNFGSYPVG